MQVTVSELWRLRAGYRRKSSEGSGGNGAEGSSTRRSRPRRGRVGQGARLVNELEAGRTEETGKTVSE